MATWCCSPHSFSNPLVGTHRQDVEPMVVQELTAAAGLQGKQNWAFILSSSARVSEVTYETVVAVRYPELDANTPTRVVGNCLADRQARIGGYLPVFWRSPRSVIHATGDIGQMIQLDYRASGVESRRKRMPGTEMICQARSIAQSGLLTRKAE